MKESPILETTSKADTIMLAVIVLIGVCMRIIQPVHPELFIDEAWSWSVSRLPIADIWRLSFSDPHPPLYYLLLKGTLLLLPSTEFGLRALSIFCSISSLFIIVIFVKRWWGIRAACYASWFTILSSFELYYAQSARMYALLGLLWLFSYVSLIESRCHPRLFIAWILVNVLLPWIHFYRLLVVATNISFLFIYWMWFKIRRKSVPFKEIWVGLGISVPVIGSLPVLPWFLQHTNRFVGGAWFPGFKEPVRFLSVFTIGMPMLPSNDEKVFQVFLVIPEPVWWFLGILISFLALFGIIKTWKTSETQLETIVLGITLMIVPVTVAYLYSLLTHSRSWAQKPFIGVSYILFIWMGIGLSHIQRPFLRRSIVASVLAISLLSLIPYYTLYQRSDAADAFRALPIKMDEHNVVLVNYTWFAPLALFYLGEDKPIWGNQDTLTMIMPKTHPLPESMTPIDCHSSSFEKITDVWMYEGFMAGPYPDCLSKKRLWIFRSGQWIRR